MPGYPWIFSTDYANINQEHLQHVNLDKPIIVIELSPRNLILLIDGHHRGRKAQEQQVTHLPAYLLTVKQHTPFFISKERYDAYIDYYNEKARFVQKAFK